MNMVMILIPLLLLSVEFSKAGVINISSPRNAQSQNTENEEQEEQVAVPKVVVTISNDGFRVFNQNPGVSEAEFMPWMQPVAGCPGAGETATSTNPYDTASMEATICLRDGTTDAQPLIERLDFAALYNHVARIKLQDQWFDRFNEENNSVISILADNEVPFEVVIKTMDATRFFLNPSGNAGLEAPTATAPDTDYLLGGGSEPTLQMFEEATYVMTGSDDPNDKFAPLFPDPVLLLPRPGSDG